PRRPTARGAAGVEEPVVEPARSTLPELNAAWNHAIPAPVLGQGHDPRAEASGKLLLAPLQLVARGDFRALLRDPGPDLCRPRAGLEIRLALRPPHALDRPLDPHLPLERRPVEAQGRPRVGGQLAPLAAEVVGEEGETARVYGFEEHDARRRRARGAHRPQGHRVRFRHVGGHRLVEPEDGLVDRVRKRRRLVEAAAAVVDAEARGDHEGPGRLRELLAITFGHDGPCYHSIAQPASVRKFFTFLPRHSVYSIE